MRPGVRRRLRGRERRRCPWGTSGHCGVMSSGDRPILLLDVDGVLNAPARELREGWQRGLHEPGRVEIQWLTTWTTNADELLAEPMGLPRGLKVHDRDDAAPTGYSGPAGGLSGWWTLATAVAVAEAEPGRRIIWIDDDLAEQADDTAEWLATRPNVLVVAPDLLEGLTHEQLDEIEAWL